MRKTIQGISVEIGGDTTGLKKALSGIDSSLRNTQGELRDINKLLKLDPGNTELLAQKQKALGDAISSTKDRLDILRKASEKAEAELAAGNLGQDKYDALQREIIETENKLKGLQTQASKTDSKLNASTSGLEKMSKAAGNASEKLSGVSKGAGVLMGAMAGSVPATQELRRDLSFLEQNAKQVDANMADVTDTFKIFNAVSGETDSSVEGISNLLQAGFKGSSLQEAVEGLSGAVTRFPDTLKVESLADSLQETLATGKATGQFGELLDRLGVGADNFSEGLAKCKTSAEKQNYALETMAKAGLMDSYKGWKENNKEMVEYEDATIDMQMAISDLATEMAPLVTKIVELGTKGIKTFTSLPEGIQNTVIGLTGATAAASPFLKVVSTLTDKSTTLGTVSSNVFKIIAGNPYTLAAGAALSLAAGIKAVVDNMNAEVKAAQAAAEEREKMVTSVEAEYIQADKYYSKLKELVAVENKTASQKQLMQTYVDQLNGSVEGLNLSYDEQTDKLNMTTEALYDKIEAQKQEAIAAAYTKVAEEALSDYVEKQMEASQKQEELAEIEDKIAKIRQKGASATTAELNQLASLEAQSETLKTDIEDLSDAQVEYAIEAQKATNQAQLQTGVWASLLEQAGYTADQLSPTLQEGINKGIYEIPSSVEELNSLIKFDQAVQNANLGGSETVRQLAAQIYGGELTIDEAIAYINSSAGGEMDKLKTKADTAGKNAGAAEASGLSSKSDIVKNAGQALASAAEKGASEADLYSVGQQSGAGFSRGLLSMISNAANAAARLAREAQAAAEREADIHSPSGKWRDEVGKMAGAGYVIGLEKMIPDAEKVASRLSEATLVTGQRNIENRSVIQENITGTMDYQQMYAAFAGALQSMNMAIVMDNREVGRALRGQGVQFK